MKTYSLSCNWQISMPKDWNGEYNEADGQYVFFPDGSDLTIRATPFHAERDGVLAPEQVMEKAYMSSIPPTAVQRDAEPYSLSGFAVKMYENNVTMGNQMLYVIYVGYYAAGELLSVSVWGTDKPQCEQALEYLKTIKKQ
ncbi:MAG: hypothetical protein E7559_06975 [Ruminococcaceae bacterium]|nr:hypothetical protein [Oscillospiraceae bacterium]